jgi:hypothetical protein
LQNAIFEKKMREGYTGPINDRLKLLIDGFDNATYLDRRGIVGPDRWFDEIHPNKAAFADIAARYQVEIDRLTSPV